MVPASLPFLAYITLPAGRDSFHCSLVGGHIQVHFTGFALGRVQISGWLLGSRHMLYMVKTKGTYIQSIVLQEGVHTIHHFA